ncbi:MAG: TPM domain-containing protein [Armatimonadota bacterium]|nr:TPM domain-containing protein [Armatimonadota bacterium]MDR5703909.1 TPM domain-containing protein [Armatimonadota bacterium]MDR7435201.1 TPM domain-containing protein [Armatimonadota bacterium]
MRHIRLWPIIGAFLLLLAAYAAASPAFPPATGFVNDFAGILDPITRAELESRLQAYEKQTTNEIAIAIFPDLGGTPIEEFAVRLEEAWKVGKQGKDNGVLLVVAMRERQVRIEVGYGLEGRLPDSEAGRIIREIIVPRFRQGEFGRGLIEAVDAIITAIGENSTQPGTPLKPVRWSISGQFWLALAFAIAIFAAVILSQRASRRRCPRCGTVLEVTERELPSHLGMARWYRIYTCPQCGYREKLLISRRPTPFGGWIGPIPGGWGSGGFGGGGFGGFGGGASGGGGATGRW